MGSRRKEQRRGETFKSKGENKCEKVRSFFPLKSSRLNLVNLLPDNKNGDYNRNAENSLHLRILYFKRTPGLWFYLSDGNSYIYIKASSQDILKNLYCGVKFNSFPWQQIPVFYYFYHKTFFPWSLNLSLSYSKWIIPLFSMGMKRCFTLPCN